MKRITILAAIAMVASVSVASAQTAATTNTMQAPNSTQGAGAASGNDNQAVATTSANAATPAHGSNSFTQHQAMHRIAKHGFTQVKDLMKDDQGVWRGTAMQNGQPAKVWLDYKGNVGTE